MPFPKANEKQHHCPTGSVAHTLSKFTPRALAWSGWPRLPGLMSPTGCSDHGVDSSGLYQSFHVPLHPRQKWANPTRQGDFSSPTPCFSRCLVHRHAHNQPSGSWTRLTTLPANLRPLTVSSGTGFHLLVPQ